MGYYLLSAEATFSAAHTLAGVDKCERMHGHNWRVRATVRVDERDLGRAGMGVDFRVIERIVRETVDAFEHRYLNELPAFADHAPSAERVAWVVNEAVASRLAGEAPQAAVEQIEVWELPEYRVVYRP